jgi:competence protein ComFC
VGSSAHVTNRETAGWLTQACDALVSLFFPAGCRLCDSLLTKASRVPICETCLASFVPVPAPFCSVCGQQIFTFSAPGEPPTLCRACQDHTYAFDLARSYASYDGSIVQALLLLKFEPILPLAAWFADRLAELVRSRPEDFPVDVVIPVPLHPQRERERGYNQAGLIARPLARKIGLPYRPILLVRTRPRPDKQLLSLEERWESVRGAFATQKGTRVDNLRVLLVDDVMTTGATLDACSRALRDAGAKQVIGLTVARAIRNSPPGGKV